MSKFITLALSLLMCTFSPLFSQVSDTIPTSEPTAVDTPAVQYFSKIDTVKGAILRNQPDQVKSIILGLQPIDFTYSLAYNLNLGLGAHIDYVHGTRFGLHVDFSQQYLNGLSEGATYEPDVPQEQQSELKTRALPTDYEDGQRLSFTGWYALKNKRKEGDVQRLLRGKSAVAFISEQQSEIRGTYVKTTAIRFGAQKNRGLVFDDNKGFGFKSTDGEDYELKDVQAMVRSTELFLGVAFRTTDDVKVSMQSGPHILKKETTSYKEIYIDALYASRFDIGTVNYFDEGVFTKTLDLNSTIISPYGFRLGFRGTTLHRWFGTGFFMEGGVHPSFDFDSISGVYFRGGFSFLFGGKVL